MDTPAGGERTSAMAATAGGAGAAGRSAARARIAAAVRYLRPTERSAHDLGISVDLDAGVEIEDLTSSHEIATSREDNVMKPELVLVHADHLVDLARSAAHEQALTDGIAARPEQASRGFADHRY